MRNLAVEILRHARTNPDDTAMRAGALSLTYAELEHAAWKAARALKGQGVAEGSVVGLALRDSQRTYVVMLGAWLLGATCNLLDFQSSAEDRRGFCQIFGTALLLEDRKTADDDCPRLSLADWDGLVAAAPAQPIDAPDPKAPALILVTSGTTGKPASFEITHHAALCRARAWTGTRTFETYKRTLCMGPMSFGANFGWVTNALLYGATVTFFPPMNRPRDICQVFRKNRITCGVMVPTVLRDLLAYVRDTGDWIEDDGEKPWLVTTGAVISGEELRAVQGTLTPKIIQVYASSPIGPVTALFSDDFDGRIDTVGRPLFGVEVQIVDENGTPQPAGTIGQVRIKSPGRATIIRGRDPDGGGDRITGDWYYPGDLGFLDHDGYLTLAGRSTDVIIRGGINIYPHEIETAVAAMPGVRQVAAIGYPEPRLGEEIALFAVVDPSVSADELRDFCRRNLNPSKRPKQFEITTRIPLNPNGKVMRQALRRRFLAAQADST